ncbi:MAG: beta-ketoacyl-[acyl-carrier-protein] synthase family protein [Verrucomicrobiota bacterium]
MTRKTVVTGLGLATPFGKKTLAEDWQCLLSGESARREVDFFDVSQSRCKQAAFSPLFHQTPFRSRSVALAHHALDQALVQAHLLNQHRQVIIPDLSFSVSTTAGAMARGEEFVRRILAHKKGRRLKAIDTYQGQQQVLELQQTFGITGRSHIVCNACASGANAIGHGHDWIQAGWAECVIVGGYEALTELLFYGFDSLQSLAPESCKPFDLHRDGLMIGEGAGFLVLETEEHAQKRGVPILAEIAGYGHTTDLHHLTQPHPEGIALQKAMNQALTQSDIRLDEIGYLNSHGTGTSMNDGAEFKSYQGVFGESISSLQISSTKATTGHTLGAAGAIEAIFSILALREGQAPPQMNTLHPIPEIASLLVKPNQPLQNWRATMSVNLGFGGSNAALVFKKHSA